MSTENKKPEKFYRICQVNHEGDIRLFETYQFGEPNNWFALESEADEWIQENFIDAHPGTVKNIATLIVLPVWTVTFKANQ